MKKHRLKIFKEYELGKNKDGKGQRGDLVIVKMKPKSDMFNLKRIDDLGQREIDRINRAL